MYNVKDSLLGGLTTLMATQVFNKFAVELLLSVVVGLLAPLLKSLIVLIINKIKQKYGKI